MQNIKTQIIQKNDYIINTYRAKRFNNKFLITTDHGFFIFLNENEFALLRQNKLQENLELFKKLEEKGILLTEKNHDEIIKKFREKNSFLFQGTSLHIVIPTLRCDHNCIYCHASSKPLNAKGYDMNKETAKKFVDFVFQSPSYPITIEFQGGEPLLRFDIIKFIVEYAKKLNKEYKKNLLITIVTNLNFMDKKKLDFLVKNNIGICTSLDGPAELHDKNRIALSGKSSYALIAKWAKIINEEYKKRKINRRLNALITITKNSLNYPKKIVDTYVNLGIRDIHLRFLNNLGDARPIWNKISYSATQFIRFWKKSMNYIIELNKKNIPIRERTTKIILQKIFENRDPNYLDLRSPCGAAIGQLAYNYNGDIFTCDEGRMLAEDIFKLGNVKNNNYKQILTSDQTCAIVASSINIFCDNCAFKPYCGICPVCNYAEQGSIIGKIPITNRCKILKAQFNYVFNKLLNDQKAKKIFLKWIGK